MKYRVQRGVVEVKARSSLHDTVTKFSKLDGTIDFDADNTAAARADLALDMRIFDAGDRLKNWKLKDEIAPDQYPTATFTLARFADIHEMIAGKFTATALGQLKYRGKMPEIRVKGEATVDRRTIEAKASFELNMPRDLGMQPPKILMFKIEDVVSVQVSLVAFATDK
jgi:polyisoprenoid-binding protein YceI